MNIVNIVEIVDIVMIVNIVEIVEIVEATLAVRELDWCSTDHFHCPYQLLEYQLCGKAEFDKLMSAPPPLTLIYNCANRNVIACYSFISEEIFFNKTNFFFLAL